MFRSDNNSEWDGKHAKKDRESCIVLDEQAKKVEIKRKK